MADDLFHNWVGTEIPGAWYRNRPWYPTTSIFVRWVTTIPDAQGGSYPGPGSFGTTTDFCIEAEEYDRSCQNRVWDSLAGTLVWWETSSPDTTGASYPGPGTFGTDTSDYCLTVLSRSVS